MKDEEAMDNSEYEATSGAMNASIFQIPERQPLTPDS